MFVLPRLGYEYGALEPYIDTQTMEIHHTKHHQTYIDNLNGALDKYEPLRSMTLRDMMIHLQQLPENVRTIVRNHGGGHFNHSMFWTLMKRKADTEPRGSIAQAIQKSFGTFAAFQDTFNTAARTVFGSGWAWLCLDKQERLVVIATPNQDNPLSQGLEPLLGLDVWEHAYYLKYQNKRPDYIQAWWHVINWEHVEENYQNAYGKK